MAAPGFRWSISILTIPSREDYLRRLLASLAETDLASRAEIVIIYNTRPEEPSFEVEARIRRWGDGIPVSVHFNPQDTSIAGGRALQLTLCKAPLLCFLDDDLTLHGDVFPILEETLEEHPLGLVGLPSLERDTDVRFKPRDSTPSVTLEGIRHMTVQGMLVAGYRDLLLDVGGFNPRRRFWGEWTELNLRLWRSGFPTGYRMDGGYLRHWTDAPESPTRNMEGREAHVLWGLVCTAIEYDAVDVNQATETFWQLVEDRYLAYSFGDRLSPTRLLRAALELMPALSSEWPQLMEFRSRVRLHPFPFKPFHPLTEAEVREVRRHAREAIAPYRESVWGRPRRSVAVAGRAPRRGLIRKFLARLAGR